MNAAESGGTVERFKPATDELIVQLTAAANEYADGFDGGGDRTLWGLNLTSFMGERMGVVLRRLHDAERQLAQTGRSNG